MKLQDVSFRLTRIAHRTVSVVVFALTGLTVTFAHADNYNMAVQGNTPIAVSGNQSSVQITNSNGSASYTSVIALSPGVVLTGDLVNGQRLAVYTSYNGSGNVVGFGSGSTLNLYGNTLNGAVGIQSNYDGLGNYYLSASPLSAVNVGGATAFNGAVYATNINLGAGTNARFASNVYGNLNYGGNQASVTFANNTNLSGAITNVASSTNGSLIFEGNANVSGNVGNGASTVGTVQLLGYGDVVSVGGSLSAVNVDFQAQSTLTVGGNLKLFADASYGTASNLVTLRSTGSTLNLGGSLQGISGQNAISTTLNNSGTLNMLGGTQSIVGNIGSSQYALGAVNIGASGNNSTTTASGNIYAQTITLNNYSNANSSLIMAGVSNGAAYSITGNVVTNANHYGVLTLQGGVQSVTGSVGASGASLNSVSSGADGAQSTFTGNVYADNVLNTGTQSNSGTSNFGGNVTATSIGVNAGVSNFIGNVTATTTTITSGTGNFNTNGFSTTSSNLVVGTGVANLNTGLQGAINFSDDGKVNVASAQFIMGAVTAASNKGTVSMLGGIQQIGGDVGASGSALKVLNVGGTGSNVGLDTTGALASSSTTVNGNVYANTIALNSNGGTNSALTLASGKNITGNVTTNANTYGVLNLSGGIQSVTGQVGAAGAALNSVVAQGTAGSQSSFSGMVYANTLSIQNDAAKVVLNGTNATTGASGGLVGTANLNNKTAELDIGNGVNLVTTGANAFQFSNAAHGSLQFLGSSVVTGDMGSASNYFGSIYAGATGATTTFRGNVFVSDHTFDVSGTGVVNFLGNLNGPLVYLADGSVNVADGKVITQAVSTMANNTGTLNFVGGTTLQADIGASGANLQSVAFHANTTDSATLPVTPGAATTNIGYNVYAATTTIGNNTTGNTTTANITATGKYLGNALTLGGAGVTLNTAGGLQSTPSLSSVDFANTQNADGSLTNAAVVTQSTTGTGAITTNGATLNFALGTQAWSAVNGGGLANASASSNITGGAGSTLVMSGSETVNASLLGSLRNGASFNLINVAGGSTGATSATLRDNSYVIDTTLSRVGGDLVLTASRDANTYMTKSLLSSGFYANNAAVRLGTLAANGTGYSADLQTVLNKLDIDQWGYGNNAANLAAQVKRLAPIANNSLQQTAFDTSSMGLANVGNRLWEMQGSGNVDQQQGFWIKSDVAKTNQSASGDYDGYHATMSGLSLGYDMRPDLRSVAGLALSYGSASISQDNFRAGEGSSVSTSQLTAYGAYNFTPELYLDAALGYGLHDFSSSRSTIVGRVATAGYDGSQITGRLTGGYRIKLDDEVSTITPMISVEQARLKQDGYTEGQAGGVGLQVAARTYSRNQSSLGMRFNTRTYWGGVLIKPEASFAAGRESTNYDQGIVASFIGDNSGAVFTTPTLNPSTGFSNLGLGASLSLSNTASMIVRYNNTHRGGFTQQSVMLLARWAL